MPTKTKKQAANRRPNGQFAPGNTEGEGHRFKPGESGNLAGRPHRTKLSEALIDQLAGIAPGTDGKTVAETIARSLILQAVRGNVMAAREIADRTEGRPRQALDIDLTTPDLRRMIEDHGLTRSDIAIALEESKRLLESALAERDSESDPAED